MSTDTNIIVQNENFADLNPVLFGYGACDKSYAYGPVIRTHWVIHFIVSGLGVYKIDDKIYNLGAGEMFVIPPYVETYYEADSQKPWSYIWIGFSSDKKLPVKLKHTLRCPEALDIFNSMKSCVERTGSNRTVFLCAKLWELFAIIYENKKHPSDYIEMALSCIHAEYMSGITIDEIAGRLNLDRTYFSSIFKKRVGISPKQYLFNYRMGIAASLLVNQRTNVSITASSVGYNNIFSFSKMFKKHYGLSPMEYVKKYSS